MGFTGFTGFTGSIVIVESWVSILGITVMVWLILMSCRVRGFLPGCGETERGWVSA